VPTIEAWLQGAIDDVTRASRQDVRPVLEALAHAAQALRDAEWNTDAARGEDVGISTAETAERG